MQRAGWRLPRLALPMWQAGLRTDGARDCDGELKLGSVAARRGDDCRSPRCPGVRMGAVRSGRLPEPRSRGIAEKIGAAGYARVVQTDQENPRRTRAIGSLRRRNRSGWGRARRIRQTAPAIGLSSQVRDFGAGAAGWAPVSQFHFVKPLARNREEWFRAGWRPGEPGRSECDAASATVDAGRGRACDAELMCCSGWSTSHAEVVGPRTSVGGGGDRSEIGSREHLPKARGAAHRVALMRPPLSRDCNSSGSASPARRSGAPGYMGCRPPDRPAGHPAGRRRWDAARPGHQ